MNHKENFSEPETSSNTVFDAPITRKRAGGALFSLTSIFFVFGILLAFGMRSIESVRKNSVTEKRSLELKQKQMEEMQASLIREEKESKALKSQIATYEEQVAANGKASAALTAKYKDQMKKLQMQVGMSAVKGKGVVIRVSDNPEAVANAGPNPGPFLPGIVHDFDLLQIVNELRNSKAEAIAINGIRITGFTPIRCVGAPIYINYEVTTAPFVIEAIGNPTDLKNALSMPGGIVQNLREQATLGVKITESDDLSLPAAENLPALRMSKPM